MFRCKSRDQFNTLCISGRSRTLWVFSVGLNRGFNKFLHKWVLKSNRRVYLPKARRAFDPRGLRGHAPPENLEVLDYRRCIFMHFQVFFCCFVVSFFRSEVNEKQRRFSFQYPQLTLGGISLVWPLLFWHWHEICIHTLSQFSSISAEMPCTFFLT